MNLLHIKAGLAGSAAALASMTRPAFAQEQQVDRGAQPLADDTAIIVTALRTD